jgi:drug/metabolite transporter (DMT)-like permease
MGRAGTEAAAAPARPAWASAGLLAVGVCAASVSAILVRYATGAEPLAMSFWRCAAGAALLAPFARRGSFGGRLEKRLSLAAGAFLAVHFASWITSLELTTVASSVLLVSTSPIFVALAARVWLHERLPPAGWGGIALSFAGAAVVGGGSLGGSSAAGDALALLGGATAGGYVLLGGRARRTLELIPYATLTYAITAVLLLVACVLARAPLWGWRATTWWAIAGMVAGPQLLGHTVINLVLDDIDATTVSVAIMAEPAIATALAYALFGEVPSLLVYPGGAAILAGIYLVSTARRRPPDLVE